MCLKELGALKNLTSRDQSHWHRPRPTCNKGFKPCLMQGVAATNYPGPVFGMNLNKQSKTSEGQPVNRKLHRNRREPRMTKSSTETG